MRKTLFIIATFITLFSCTKTPVCSGIIFHQVKITDTLGKAITLDKFYMVCLNNSDTLYIKRYFPDSLQYYPLIDDNYSSLFQKDVPLNFQFTGIKNTDTISSPYTFKYDGCHISLVSGTAKIIY